MLSLLDSHFSLGVVSTSLIILRLFLAPLALYNACWSFKGFVNLIKGTELPISAYQTGIFLTSFAVLCFQILGLANHPDASSGTFALVIVCIFFIMQAITAVSRRYSLFAQIDKFYWLFQSNNLELASRAADMGRMDPDFALELIAQAETQMVLHVAQKTLSDEPS